MLNRNVKLCRKQYREIKRLISDNSEKSKKDYIDKLYECYNREISTLWQRSVFLGAFMLGIFTAYGKCWEVIIDKGKIRLEAFKGTTVGLLAVSVLGIAFSLLWIMMAKSSKAWQEVYEIKIRAFESYFALYEKNFTEKKDSGEKFKKTTGVEPNILGQINKRIFKKYEKNGTKIGYTNDFCKNIFDTRGGEFSPSKVNILVGQVFLVFWYIALFLHSSVFFSACCYKCVKDCQSKDIFSWMHSTANYMCFFAGALVSFVLVYSLKILLEKKSHSYALEDYDV